MYETIITIWHQNPPRHLLLEMVLQSHVEIKGVTSVPEANSYESAAACRPEKMVNWVV